MAPSKIRKAIGTVKDKTSIGLARVGSSNSLSDLDIAIVKATRHEEYPPDERYIHQILCLTTHSHAYVSSCISTIARRLNKTKNWVVALKTLVLIHRLLSEGDLAYEQEIFFATRHGTRLLNMSDFRDASGKSNSWDYSAFVRSYALYLDEQLEFRMQGRRGKHSGYAHHTEEEEGNGRGANSNAMVMRTTPVSEMKSERIFSRVHHLMQLLDRFLACRPTGAARDNRVVAAALYPIVKESFQLCYDITEVMGVWIDRFMQMEIPDMVKVQKIFCRVSKQYDEVDEFHGWCKTLGIGRSSEYPDVEKIPQKKLDMMEEYIHEKSTMSKNRRARNAEPEPEPEPELVEEVSKEAEPEEEMNEIKASPPPEELAKETEKKEQKVEEDTREEKKTQEVGDLLNLGEAAPSTEEQRDILALALFDGGPAQTAPATTANPWEAFNETSGDWEMALVQSASHLANQKASLPGGFDTLMLDGMYQQGATTQASTSSGLVATGSASSIALGSAGRPAMLALPAPPTPDGGTTSFSTNLDPFAASIGIAPPPYVQMSEMEKKQRLLVEEQLMWQKFERDGMQGQVALAKVQQQNPCQYNTGGYTPTY